MGSKDHKKYSKKSTEIETSYQCSEISYFVICIKSNKLS